MKWFRIPKETTKIPIAGKYSDWKSELAVEGKKQCVYCTINIKSFGGIRNFHIEHYKPKDKKYFPELIDEFSNLFFACSICNCFKGNDWHVEPIQNLGGKFYPNPAEVDYSSFLEIDDSFQVKSNFKTGEFIINKIYLNRPQLLAERRSYHLHETLSVEYLKLIELLDALQEKFEDNPLIQPFRTVMESSVLLIKEKYIDPYSIDEISR